MQELLRSELKRGLARCSSLRGGEADEAIRADGKKVRLIHYARNDVEKPSLEWQFPRKLPVGAPTSADKLHAKSEADWSAAQSSWTLTPCCLLTSHAQLPPKLVDFRLRLQSTLRPSTFHSLDRRFTAFDGIGDRRQNTRWRKLRIDQEVQNLFCRDDRVVRLTSGEDQRGINIRSFKVGIILKDRLSGFASRQQA